MNSSIWVWAGLCFGATVLAFVFVKIHFHKIRTLRQELPLMEWVSLEKLRLLYGKRIKLALLTLHSQGMLEIKPSVKALEKWDYNPKTIEVYLRKRSDTVQDAEW